MMDSSRACLVITTTDSIEKAEQLATTMVDEHLAACVQITGPITSVYRWEGRVEKAQEWKCSFKTSIDREGDLVKAIRATHSYDEPEVISIAISGGSDSYLEWLEKQVTE